MGLTVRDLLRARLGVPTVPVRNRAASSVSITAANVLRNDPSRASFELVNLGAFTVFITPHGEPSSTNGFRVEPNGGVLFVEWEVDGEVVAWPWRAIAIGGLTALFILENLIYTGPEQAPTRPA
ncbi:MAG: hypothetical protein ACREKK_00435 [Candidatus Methylomirabilales bacterium]